MAGSDRCPRRPGPASPEGTAPIVLVFLLVLFVWIRIPLLVNHVRNVEPDEAMGGLQVLHILSRGESPVFFYQFLIGGGDALMAYPSALLCALFGFDPLVNAIPFFLNSILNVILVYLWLGRTVSKTAGLIGALLFVFPGLDFTLHNVALLRYNLVVTSLLLLMVFFGRFAASRDEASAFTGILLGLLTGFGGYLHEATATLGIACALVVGALKGRKAAGPFFWLAFLAGLAVGFAPHLVALVAGGHHFVKEHSLYVAGVTDFLDPLFLLKGAGDLILVHYANFLSFDAVRIGPTGLSLAIGSLDASIATFSLLLVSAGALIANSRAQPLPWRRRILDAPELLPILCSSLYSWEYINYSLKSHRHLVPLHPMLLVLMAIVSTRSLYGGPRRWPRLVLSALPIAALLANLIPSVATHLSVRSSQASTAADVWEVVRTLEYLGIERVYSTDATSWRITYESGERIIATSDGVDAPNSSYEYYRDSVMSSGRIAYVLPMGKEQPSNPGTERELSFAMEEILEEQGVRYRKLELAAHAVYFDLDPTLHLSRLGDSFLADRASAEGVPDP